MVAKKNLVLFMVVLFIITFADLTAHATSRGRDYRVESGSESGSETCRGRCTRLEQECATGCRDTYSENNAGCTTNAQAQIKRAMRGSNVNVVHAGRAIQLQGECMDDEADAYMACTDDCREGGWQCRDSCPD